MGNREDLVRQRLAREAQLAAEKEKELQARQSQDVKALEIKVRRLVENIRIESERVIKLADQSADWSLGRLATWVVDVKVTARYWRRPRIKKQTVELAFLKVSQSIVIRSDNTLYYDNGRWGMTPLMTYVGEQRIQRPCDVGVLLTFKERAVTVLEQLEHPVYMRR